MYQLKYDEINNEIIQIDPTGKETTIANDSPSEPIFSPNSQKAIYISPLEWECLGSLYIYNLEEGYIRELVAPDGDQNIPKYAEWIDDDSIAIIIGFGMGTVQVGGNVFIYNLTNQKLSQVTTYPSKIQITKLSINNEKIELYGIEYLDKDYIKFKEFNDILSLNSTI